MSKSLPAGKHPANEPSKPGRELLVVELRQIDDARFESHGSRRLLRMPNWYSPSTHAVDLAQLLQDTLKAHKLHGGQDMTRHLRFKDCGNNRVVTEIVIMTSASDQTSTEEIQLAIEPVISKVYSGRDLFTETASDVPSQQLEAVTAMIREFQLKYAGKRPAEEMNIKIGDSSHATIQGGVWRSTGLTAVEGETREVWAVCNGLICDKRLAFLKECADNKITGHKYEAHYDQKRHEPDIRDAAGRQDRLLRMTLREEVTLRKTTLHITKLEVVYPDDLDFMLSSPGQLGPQ